jgi:3-phosphoshikimate 1-carboxyvinyltransferase
VTPRLLPGPKIELRATVEVPTSKSLTNRALIAAAVADGGRISSPLDCDDTRVLAAALGAAGWGIEWSSDIEIGRRTNPEGHYALDLGDSGTGARLLLGLLAAIPGSVTVDGSARLRERPMAPLVRALDRLGARVTTSGGQLPVSIVGGELEGGSVEIRPECSSQFVSSLLLAAPLMRKGLELEITGQLPSVPYLDLTHEVLRSFGCGIVASTDRRHWKVPPGPLRPTEISIEGDWSAAAFALAAAAVAGGRVIVAPLDPASRQGDRAVLRLLRDAGLDSAWEGDHLIVRGPVTTPIVADLHHTPDLFPALVVVAACAPPGSRLCGLEHLAYKESDRLRVMVDNLGRLGATIAVEGATLTVVRGVQLAKGPPRTVNAASDHRVAMALAVAALRAGPLLLDDGDCVSKSFPTFWGMWNRVTQPSEV